MNETPIEWTETRAFVDGKLIAIRRDVYIGRVLGVWDAAAGRMRWELISDGGRATDLLETLHNIGKAPPIPAGADLSI